MSTLDGLTTVIICRVDLWPTTVNPKTDYRKISSLIKWHILVEHHAGLKLQVFAESIKYRATQRRSSAKP